MQMDEPSVGPGDGPDEKDRALMDEFHPKYTFSTTMKFFTDRFAQISAQGNVLAPGRRSPTAHHGPDESTHLDPTDVFWVISPIG